MGSISIYIPRTQYVAAFFQKYEFYTTYLDMPPRKHDKAGNMYEPPFLAKTVPTPLLSAWHPEYGYFHTDGQSIV
jgi:hypothetical protein